MGTVSPPFAGPPGGWCTQVVVDATLQENVHGFTATVHRARSDRQEASHESAPDLILIDIMSGNAPRRQ